MTNMEILTHQAIQSIADKMRDQKEINWEQRRYEIAKNVFCTLLGNQDVLRSAAINHQTRRVAMSAIDLANLLIEELKKYPTK